MGESGIISHTESSPGNFCFEMKGQYGTHGKDKRRVVSRIRARYVASPGPDA